LTGAELTLLTSCVTEVWGVALYSGLALQQALNRMDEICGEVDAASGKAPSDSGSITGPLMVATVIGVPRLYELSLAIQTEYFANNDAIVTDDTKRAIAACTIAIGDPIRFYAEDGTFDVAAVGDVVEICEPALNATRIDASLDGDGVSIARLVSLDVAAIISILAGSIVEPLENFAVITEFAIPLSDLAERLSELLPLL
jgi:hypothetical protein